MSSDRAPNGPHEGNPGGGDPWVAFGYLVAGVGFYGFLGWILGRWLHASYLTPLGIVLGAAFGLYLVFKRYARVPDPSDTTTYRVTSSETTDEAGIAGDDDR
ncbi:MAG: AtpZ/AtpI family protein [Actinomycetota bacterium]